MLNLYTQQYHKPNEVIKMDIEKLMDGREPSIETNTIIEIDVISLSDNNMKFNTLWNTEDNTEIWVDIRKQLNEIKYQDKPKMKYEEIEIASR